jgi:adenylate kinase family enzyme
MKEGKLVPDATIIALLKTAMAKAQTNKFILDGFPRLETYSRIGLLRCYRKLTVVLDYYDAIGNLQSYWTTTGL